MRRDPIISTATNDYCCVKNDILALLRSLGLGKRIASQLLVHVWVLELVLVPILVVVLVVLVPVLVLVLVLCAWEQSLTPRGGARSAA